MNSTLIVDFQTYLGELLTLGTPWAIGMQIIFWILAVVCVILSADQFSKNEGDEKFKSILGLLLLFIPVYIIGGFFIIRYTALWNL